MTDQREYHSQYRLTTEVGQDPRSAMARASDARPFKPYVYGGDPGPVISRPGHPREETAPAPEPGATLAARCDGCGYLTTAIGHKAACT
jgi:hypothetical protein